MRILLSGYGGMGHAVEKLAIERGHEVVGVFSHRNVRNCPYKVYENAEEFPEADIIIDFSYPYNTKYLLDNAEKHRIPIIVATTGESEVIQSMMESASKYIPVFFGANMSYGVHILMELLKYATPLLSDYDIEIVEKHHNKKVDAPSGTSKDLLESIQSVSDGHFPIYDRSGVSKKRDPKEIGISSIRGGTIISEHEVMYSGIDETIQLIHRAQSNDIFADGALKVTEVLIEKAPGYYEFSSI